MTLQQLPRWSALADLAMDELGADAGDIRVAILAQWTCEQRGAWPPVHNNPGFVTAGAMTSVGYQAAAATSSPGAGFLAAFTTPEQGAHAYGYLIAHGRRYAATRAAAAAGNGARYLREITAAHYGTRWSCCYGAYVRMGGRYRISATGTVTDTGGGSGASGTADPATAGAGAATATNASWIPQLPDLNALGAQFATLGRDLVYLVFILALILIGLYQVTSSSETVRKAGALAARAAAAAV